MYAFDESIAIAATPERVWRALCDPAEVVRWDAGVSAALDAPADYPRPGQHVRWRCGGRIFRVLHDRPVEVDAPRRLRSLLRVGLVRFDETYTLAPRDGGVLLTAAMLLWLPLPPVAAPLERWYAGPAARAAVAASLRSLQRHCERDG